jgi:hypothetical protein
VQPGSLAAADDIELVDGSDPATRHVLLQSSTTTHKIRLGADKLVSEVAGGSSKGAMVVIN